MQVYNYPHLYEIAFSYRDIPGEMDFVEEVIRRYSLIPVKTILELASGNSPHVDEICRRGYKYLGLELNENMIDWSRRKIARHNLDASVLQGNMVDFTLSQSADCVVVFLCSLYVRNDEEFITHLRSVAQNTAAGGLYILDGVVSHFPECMGLETWDETSDGVTVHVGYDTSWADEKVGLMSGTLSLEVDDNGERRRVQHTEIRKIYSAAEFITKAESTGDWEYIDDFSDFCVSTKPHAEGRSIVVLRRR
jgi:hypothetical protein